VKLEEKLRIAGYVAPIARDDAYKGRERRIHTIDEDGNVVRELDIAIVRAKILKRAWIELDVIDVCAGALGKPCPKRSRPGTYAMGSKAIARRNGEPWRCKLCAVRQSVPTRRPAQRKPSQTVTRRVEASRRGWADRLRELRLGTT
jgi:hypothetical protein